MVSDGVAFIQQPDLELTEDLTGQHDQDCLFAWWTSSKFIDSFPNSPFLSALQNWIWVLQIFFVCQLALKVCQWKSLERHCRRNGFCFQFLCACSIGFYSSSNIWLLQHRIVSNTQQEQFCPAHPLSGFFSGALLARHPL